MRYSAAALRLRLCVLELQEAQALFYCRSAWSQRPSLGFNAFQGLIDQ